MTAYQSFINTMRRIPILPPKEEMLLHRNNCVHGVFFGNGNNIGPQVYSLYAASELKWIMEQKDGHRWLVSTLVTCIE